MGYANLHGVAIKFAEMLKPEFEALCVRHGLDPSSVLSADEVYEVIKQSMCEHGLRRIGDCMKCGPLYIVAAQAQKIARVQMGGYLPDDDALIIAREWSMKGDTDD